MKGIPISNGVTLVNRGIRGWSVCLGCGDYTKCERDYCEVCRK